MTLPLTEDQRQAAFIHDRNVVVLAAAGTGKTRVLVERALALLAANPDWPLTSLVAITFTRKATHEMRERLRRELHARARATDGPEKAHWLKRLNEVDAARIDTIHGLCADILRHSATEAGIDPEFGILDEDLAAFELEEALQETLERLAAVQDPALALFSEYDRKQIMDATRAQVRQPEPAPLPEDLLQRWQQAWEEMAEPHLLKFKQSAAFDLALGWQQKNEWPEEDALGDLWNQRSPLILEISELSVSTHAAQIVSVLAGAVGNVGKAKNWGGSAYSKEARSILTDLRNEALLVKKEIGDGITHLDHRAAELLPLWQRLIAGAQRAYRARKRAGDLLDFDDLERLTCDILQRAEVRERFRREFRQVLVDEFHDTSPLQWEIIRALADPREPGRLFIVGDPNQSIYGFRGAEVRNFRRAQQEICAHGGQLVTLTQSFRSHRPLLDVLNRIHRETLQNDERRPLVTDRRCAPGSRPALELLRLDSNAAGVRPEEGRQQLALQLAQRLRLLVEDGLPVHDRESGRQRTLAWGDVALLFRRRNSMPDYEDAFSELELPYVTVQGVGFYKRQEVLGLLNLLRALRNPGDDLALAGVLRSPLFALSDDALLALRLMRDGVDRPPVALRTALQQTQELPLDDDDVERARVASECLDALGALAGRLTIDELLREALSRTGYLATLTGLPQGERRRANVEKLLEKAAGKASLFTEFETLFTELREREFREGEATAESENAITLMTVHQAKGLEFPLVVLADAGGGPGGGDNRAVLMRDDEFGLACRVFDAQAGTHKATVAWQLAQQRESAAALDEHRRLLYVAGTRARDWLIVCGHVKGRPEPDSWLDWLQAALDTSSREADRPFQVGGGQVLWRELEPSSVTDISAVPEAATENGASVGDISGNNLDEPGLLRPMPAKTPRILPTFAVTDLSRHFEKEFREATVVREDAEPVWQNRILGDALHAALRWWRPGQENTSALRTRIVDSLWASGIRDSQRRDALLRQATAMVARFEGSALCARMRVAGKLQFEVPFILRHRDCLLQGSIDLMLRDTAGNWTLVDYKTTDLGDGAGMAEARHHARRFQLQLGLYAAAVTGRPDIDPATLTVQLHYLRHALDVPVPLADWQEALSRVDDCLAIEMRKTGITG